MLGFRVYVLFVLVCGNKNNGDDNDNDVDDERIQRNSLNLSVASRKHAKNTQAGEQQVSGCALQFGQVCNGSSEQSSEEEAI